MAAALRSDELQQDASMGQVLFRASGMHACFGWFALRKGNKFIPLGTSTLQDDPIQGGLGWDSRMVQHSVAGWLFGFHSRRRTAELRIDMF